MANLTRRLFLRRAAIVAPLAVIPAAAVADEATRQPPASVFVPADVDAEIFRLAKTFRAAKRVQARAAEALDAIDAEIEATEPDYPPEPRMTKEEIAEHNVTPVGEALSGHYSPLMTDFLARDRAWRAARDTIKQSTVDKKRASPARRAAEEAYSKANVAVSRIGTKLYGTRARTIDGLLAKMRVEKQFQFDEWELERQIAKDLRALKKAGAVIAVSGKPER